MASGISCHPIYYLPFSVRLFASRDSGPGTLLEMNTHKKTVTNIAQKADGGSHAGFLPNLPVGDPS